MIMTLYDNGNDHHNDNDNDNNNAIIISYDDSAIANSDNKTIDL